MVKWIYQRFLALPLNLFILTTTACFVDNRNKHIFCANFPKIFPERTVRKVPAGYSHSHPAPEDDDKVGVAAVVDQGEGGVDAASYPHCLDAVSDVYPEGHIYLVQTLVVFTLFHFFFFKNLDLFSFALYLPVVALPESGLRIPGNDPVLVYRLQ